jgi:phospholipid N-methyltransferase
MLAIARQADLDALKERNRAWRAYIRPLKPLQERTLLEVGAGSGANVPHFLDFGFRPDGITLNELRPDRAAEARRAFPEVRMVECDAALMDGGPYDVVVASTLFTSILASAHRQRIAETLWRLTAPGGGVLLYDFAWNSPTNPNVRKLTAAEIRTLFPAAAAHAIRRVTLAPPLARRLPGACRRLLYCVPALRTHVVAWLEKGHGFTHDAQ